MFKTGLFKEPESLFRSLPLVFFFAAAKLGRGQAKFALSLLRYQLNVLSR